MIEKNAFDMVFIYCLKSFMMNVKFIHRYFISCQIIDFVISINYQKLILINFKLIILC